MYQKARTLTVYIAVELRSTKGVNMTHTTKHTPLDKATRAIPMLYAEAFAGSNNKEFVVELYEDARLLEKAAPAMYEALRTIKNQSLGPDWTAEQALDFIKQHAKKALAQAEGK
jgi:hypothetical protein